MYPNDNLPSLPRSYSYPIINPPNYTHDISSNLTKFIPNYHTFDNDLANSSNHASLSPTNSSINNNNSILCQDNLNEDILIKENDDDEEEMRKIKRMISNRESARRSRLRKRLQVETLKKQVLELIAINHQIGDKLVQVMEYNDQIVQENAQLREIVSELQRHANDIIMAFKGSNSNNHNSLFIRASQTSTSASITSASLDLLK